MKKLSNTEAELKKSVAIIKKRVCEFRGAACVFSNICCNNFNDKPKDQVYDNDNV